MKLTSLSLWLLRVPFIPRTSNQQTSVLVGLVSLIQLCGESCVRLKNKFGNITHKAKMVKIK